MTWFLSHSQLFQLWPDPLLQTPGLSRLEQGEGDSCLILSKLPSFLSSPSRGARRGIRCTIILPFLSPQHSSSLSSSLGSEANGSFRITSPFLSLVHAWPLNIGGCGGDIVCLLTGQPFLSGACGWFCRTCSALGASCRERALQPHPIRPRGLKSLH